jgi:hypothetical protein
MCRKIKPPFNLEPPVNDEEVRGSIGEREDRPVVNGWSPPSLNTTN